MPQAPATIHLFTLIFNKEGETNAYFRLEKQNHDHLHGTSHPDLPAHPDSLGRQSYYGKNPSPLQLFTNQNGSCQYPPEKDGKNPDKNIHIDWASRYPFDDSVKVPVQKIRYFPKPPKDTPAKRLGDWTEKNLYSYYSLAELQRSYDKTIHWNIINPVYNVVSLHDGYWAFVYKRQNMKERINSVISFKKFLQSLGIPLTYIQAPGKINKYGKQDAWLRNRYDFSNANADQLLSGLHENGIDTIDLREYFHETIPENQYHQLFFRTDHHWLPQTALAAAKFTAEYLNRKYGMETNTSNLVLKRFNVEYLPHFFLGSIGKKVTLSMTQPDDFPILHPSFSTHMYLEIPDKGINAEGPYEIIYNKEEMDPVNIKHSNFYNGDRYHAYGYGDRPLLTIHNLKFSSVSDKKLLVIKDSFGDAMIPMLSLGCKNIAVIDLRPFRGSVHSLVNQLHPDAVIILYTNNWSGSINWNEHKDEFDFR